MPKLLIELLMLLMIVHLAVQLKLLAVKLKHPAVM